MVESLRSVQYAKRRRMKPSKKKPKAEDDGDNNINRVHQEIIPTTTEQH